MTTNKNNLYYNKKLKTKADLLKKQMTKAESCLWKYCLNKHRLKGYKFRRQRPVLNYIADFMCKELMLIIEVDGITHFDENIYNKDNMRQKTLEKYGFRLIRLKDEDVLKNMEGVRIFLETVVDEISHNPPPAPSKGGYSDC